MKLDVAFQILDQVTALVALNRADHALLIQALEAVKIAALKELEIKEDNKEEK